MDIRATSGIFLTGATMPLIHSKSSKAFKENLIKELRSGKPKDQAVAIAYSVKREAQHKNHKSTK
jgi:hypothetical protein